MSMTLFEKSPLITWDHQPTSRAKMRRSTCPNRWKLFAAATEYDITLEHFIYPRRSSLWRDSIARPWNPLQHYFKQPNSTKVSRKMQFEAKFSNTTSYTTTRSMHHHSIEGTNANQSYPAYSDFEQLGTIPLYAPKKKLKPRVDPVRYMFPTSLHHIVVLNLSTNHF